MGYPDPPPSNPSGQNGPPPQYGPGPTIPTAPPPRRSNTGLILLLAIGLPLLLLGGCGAVVLVAANVGKEAVRERMAVLEAEPPTIVLPSRLPEWTPPTVGKQVATATLGGSLTLAGSSRSDPYLKVTVTPTKVVDPATSTFLKPKNGKKLVAVELALENTGQAVYDSMPSMGAVLIDGEGQQYRSTFGDVEEGQSFGTVTIDMGDTRKGMVVFELPESVKPAKFQFSLSSVFVEQTGEWTLN